MTPEGEGVAGGPAGPVEEAPAVGRPRRTAQRIAIALFGLALLGLLVLAAAGFTPAAYLLVVAVVGTLLVVIGTRLH